MKAINQCPQTQKANSLLNVIIRSCIEVLDDHCHDEGTEVLIDRDSEAKLTVEFHHRP